MVASTQLDENLRKDTYELKRCIYRLKKRGRTNKAHKIQMKYDNLMCSISDWDDAA